MQKYFDYLDIKPEASLAEIKKAYRTRAKQLHPDVNQSSNAEDEFIKLNKYYEVLLNYKNHGYFRRPTKSYSKRPPKRRKTYAEQVREDAQIRRQELERSQIQLYIHSAAYRKAFHFNEIVDKFMIACLGAFYIILVTVIIPASRTTEPDDPTYISPLIILITLLLLTTGLTLGLWALIKSNRTKRRAFLKKVELQKKKRRPKKQKT